MRPTFQYKRVLVGHLMCDIVLHALLPHYLCVGVAATTDLITASSPGILSGSGQAVERGGGGVEGEGGGGVEGEGSGGVEGEGGGMTKRPSELHPERKRGMCVCVF